MALRRPWRSIVITAAAPRRSELPRCMAADSGTSQPLHTRVGTRGQYPRSRSLLARVAPVPPGPRCFCGFLPAAPPAELGRLALLLAPLEPPLEGGKENHR